MTLRGIDFGPVLQASGATNFYGPGLRRGHGWWYHKPLYFFGLSWRGSTLVTKTTTLLPRHGNMPLKKDGVTPKEWMPKCVIVNRGEMTALNAVSLSGPGLTFLLRSGEWQRLTWPFFISVMSLAPTPGGRMAELDAMFEQLASAKRGMRFRAGWGVQINLSCPNGGVDPNDLVNEAMPTLELAGNRLPDTIPVMLKFGPDADPSSMPSIARHHRCDALCFSNTLPFGKHPGWAKYVPPVDWTKLFGTNDPKGSPIAKRFPGFAGGLSGAPLLPFVLEWVSAVRALGITTPINAGGGILSPKDAGFVFSAGADSVFLGSIAMLAPTKVQTTIRGAHRCVNSRSARRVAHSI